MNINYYNVNELKSCLSTLSIEMKGAFQGKNIAKLSTPEEADENSLIWISPSKQDKESLIARSRASIIVCDPTVKTELFPEKCFIVTENPKLAFLRIGNSLFKKPVSFGIHPTVVIHPEAKIAENVYIGPFTYIGKCEIGKGVCIEGHCYLHDNVVIRDQVIIFAGCKIGGVGLGHIFNENGDLENFPQIGGVIIEERVELGASCIVLRGALSSTRIGKNTKIDCHVIVGHNVVIGQNTLVAANSVLGGSSFIGNNVFIGINATVVDYIQIGHGAFVGAGAIVLEDIPQNTKIIARPSVIIPHEIDR